MALNELRKEYKTLQEKINALNEEMKVKSKELMKEEFREFFEKYEDVVHNIFWRQYTPYFNDGEACEFGVHDVWITLKSDAEDDDWDDDGEGSNIYSQTDIEELKQKVADWEEFIKDPLAAAKKYQSYYISRYNRDPFAHDRWTRMTPEQRMADWKPDYYSLETRRRQLADAENLVANYPDLKEDYKRVASVVNGIEEDLMKAMFGDHVKVIVTKDGIETEDYDHD